MINVDDVEELSNQMEYLISNSDIRDKLAKNARNILYTNSPDKIYNKYYEYMITKMLDKKKIKEGMRQDK